MWATVSEGPSGDALPCVLTAIPGPASRVAIDTLARHECPAITARRARRAIALGAADDDPIVWDAARGANVQDVDGNVYVDLTAGFAVALVGHRHPAVVAAVHAQADRLLHAMGDAWPDQARVKLLDRLARIAPGDLEVSILGLSGSDAVDAAIKTATLATGRTGVITFGGSYHGLSLGVVALQGYKPAFTEPFRAIAHPDVRHLPWACDLQELSAALAAGDVGMVMVEPIQGRGGMRTPPPGWLARVAELTRAAGALLAFDEIQSGLGRAGTMWAGDHDGVVPDLLCLGKALGGGMPISACMGPRRVMDAWGASRGEALHTQTFLGHPVGCAAGLAVLDTIADDALVERSRTGGAWLRGQLESRGLTVRGRGMMLGVELDHSLAVCRALMRRGFLVLPAGQQAEVLCLTPPLCITRVQLGAFLTALDEARTEVAP